MDLLCLAIARKYIDRSRFKAGFLITIQTFRSSKEPQRKYISEQLAYSTSSIMLIIHIKTVPPVHKQTNKNIYHFSIYYFKTCLVKKKKKKPNINLYQMY